MPQPLYYEFDGFIIIPRKSLIITSDITTNDTYLKTISDNTETTGYYVNKNENSILRIDNPSNVIIEDSDAILISESANSSYYKLQSFISFRELTEDPYILHITNNIGDINGGLKNISYDSSNEIVIKIDPVEYDLNWDRFSFEFNVNLNEINSLIKNNKFIKFLNSNNKYYIT